MQPLRTSVSTLAFPVYWPTWNYELAVASIGIGFSIDIEKGHIMGEVKEKLFLSWEKLPQNS